MLVGSDPISGPKHFKPSFLESEHPSQEVGESVRSGEPSAGLDLKSSEPDLRHSAPVALPGSGQNLVAVPAYAVKLEGWGPRNLVPFEVGASLTASQAIPASAGPIPPCLEVPAALFDMPGPSHVSLLVPQTPFLNVKTPNTPQSLSASRSASEADLVSSAMFCSALSAPVLELPGPLLRPSSPFLEGASVGASSFKASRDQELVVPNPDLGSSIAPSSPSFLGFFCNLRAPNANAGQGGSSSRVHGLPQVLSQTPLFWNLRPPNCRPCQVGRRPRFRALCVCEVQRLRAPCPQVLSQDPCNWGFCRWPFLLIPCKRLLCCSSRVG